MISLIHTKNTAIIFFSQEATMKTNKDLYKEQLQYALIALPVGSWLDVWMHYLVEFYYGSAILGRFIFFTYYLFCQLQDSLFSFFIGSSVKKA